MRKTKILNSLLVVFNVLIIASLILALIIKTKFAYSLYWFIVPLLILLLILVIREWSKRGKDSDIDKSKIIQRSFDDTTTLSTVFYGIIYLIIMFIDTFNENIKNSPYVLIGFFVITIIYELFIYLAIDNANKETDPNKLNENYYGWHRATFDALLNYDKQFGQHGLKALAGWHTEKYDYYILFCVFNKMCLICIKLLQMYSKQTIFIYKNQENISLTNNLIINQKAKVHTP